jgi:hypothetical protein
VEARLPVDCENLLLGSIVRGLLATVAREREREGGKSLFAEEEVAASHTAGNRPALLKQRRTRMKSGTYVGEDWPRGFQRVRHGVGRRRSGDDESRGGGSGVCSQPLAVGWVWKWREVAEAGCRSAGVQREHTSRGRAAREQRRRGHKRAVGNWALGRFTASPGSGSARGCDRDVRGTASFGQSGDRAARHLSNGAGCLWWKGCGRSRGV